MAGSIRKLPNGRWEARERTGGRDSRRLSRTFDRKGDAERWVADIRRTRQLGHLESLDDGQQRLDEFIETYWIVHAIPNLVETTRQDYGRKWETYIRPHFGKHTLRDITPKVVNRWRSQLVAKGAPAPTVRRAMTVLQSILTLAVLEEEIQFNPVARIKKPPITQGRQHVPVPVSTIEAIRAELSLYDRTLISVLAYAGLRPQEALALKFEDIGKRTIAVVRKNVGGQLLDYSKTYDHRTVNLLEPLARDIDAWREHTGHRTGLPFTRSDGGPLTPADYRNWRRRKWQATAGQVGLDDSRPYDLRATWVSLLIYESHTVVEVARQAGHSAETCLRHYARVFAEYDPADRVPAVAQIEAARARLRPQRGRPVDVGRGL